MITAADPAPGARSRLGAAAAFAVVLSASGCRGASGRAIGPGAAIAPGSGGLVLSATIAPSSGTLALSAAIGLRSGVRVLSASGPVVLAIASSVGSTILLVSGGAAISPGGGEYGAGSGPAAIVPVSAVAVGHGARRAQSGAGEGEKHGRRGPNPLTVADHQWPVLDAGKRGSESDFLRSAFRSC